MTPLVSIMMPCYNSIGTLPLALASLLVQTYQNWECILVDDGSEDNPRAVIERVRDLRIQYIRLERNAGQGAARQVALGHCRGEYLCMLDADDWIYPTKLEQQLALMERQSQLTLISSGMAIVNAQNDIVGTRIPGSQAPHSPAIRRLTRLESPPVAFAPSMIRMQAAKQVEFDFTFRRSEDADFLLKIMYHRYYRVMPEINYVYTEHASATPEKILAGYHHRMRMFWKYRQSFPAASLANVGQAAAKWFIYRIVFSLGCGQRLIAQRSQPPSGKEVEEFNQARQTVLTALQHYFNTVPMHAQMTM